MSKDALAPAPVVKVHGVLRVALSDAERMDLVPRNVAKSAKPPGLSRSERRELTPDEAKALVSAIVGDPLELLFVLALATGLRRGELLGLRWSDVDIDEKVLFVRQALQRVNGQLVIVAPKTHRSARPLPLSKLATRAVQQQKVKQAKERLKAGKLWFDNGLVFASTIGTPLEPRNVNRRFDELRKRVDLGGVSMNPWLYSDQGQIKKDLVETRGLEPLTPALQRSRRVSAGVGVRR